MSISDSVKLLGPKVESLRDLLTHLAWSIKDPGDAAPKPAPSPPPDPDHHLVTSLHDQAMDLVGKGEGCTAMVSELQQEAETGKDHHRLFDLLTQILTSVKDVRSVLATNLGSQEQLKDLAEKVGEDQSWGPWVAGVTDAIVACQKAIDEVRCEASDCWLEIASIPHTSEQVRPVTASGESPSTLGVAESPALATKDNAAPPQAPALQNAETIPVGAVNNLEPSAPQLAKSAEEPKCLPPSPETFVASTPSCNLPEKCPPDDHKERLREPIEVKREPSYGTMRVQVTSNGQGISNVAVKLLGKENAVVESERTKDDGQIEWTNVETGSYEVVLDLPENFDLKDVHINDNLTGSKEGHPVVELREGEAAKVEFQLKAVGATIHGRILEHRGGCDRPLAGVKIVITSGNHSDYVMTQGDGTFEYPANAPGLYEVKVDSSVETKGPSGIPLSPAIPTPLLIQAEAGQRYDTEDIRYVAVNGQVTVGALCDDAANSEQIPLDGLTFVLHADGSDRPDIRISGDREKYVAFSNLSAGRYTLTVTGTPSKSKKNLRLNSAGSVSLLVTPGRDFDLRKHFRFESAACEVHGSVIDEESGGPLAGVLVLLESKDQHCSPREERTNLQGQFVFSDVPAGPYRVTLASKTTAIGNHKWVLSPTAKAEVHGDVKLAEKAELPPLKLIRDRHRIVASLRDENGEGIANAALRIEDADGHLVAKVVTGLDGHVTYDVDREGMFYVVPELESGQPLKRYPAEVHSTAYVELKLGGAGKVGGGRSFGPPPPASGGAAQIVDDITSYPILTESVSFPVAQSPLGSPPAGDSSSWNRLVEGTVREVLGWRPNAKDSRGVMAALTQSFSPREAAGFTEWIHQPRSYTVQVQADMGAVTGAQASIYARAQNVLDAALPILGGLTPLIEDADLDDIESSRSIVRNQLDELIREFGTEGGPRPSRVDQLFAILTNPQLDQSGRPAIVFDPDKVGGQVGALRDRFGMSRKNVNTIDEEQNLTNFVILVDYVQTLHQSWDSQREFFDRLPHEGQQPYLGTQLVLVSRALSVVVESVTEVAFTMDSVFLGPAERGTIALDLGKDSRGKRRSPLFVSELLSWIERFAAEEAPRLIHDSGKDGIVAMKETLVQLKEFATSAATQNDVPAAFRTARVRRAWAELATQLGQVSTLIADIKRT